MFLVRSGSLEGYDQLVTRLGGNPPELLGRVGFSPAQLHRPDSYISYQKMAELLEISAATCSNSLFGLKLAERQGNMTLGELGVSATQEPTLGAALDYLSRHLSLHARGVNIQVIAGTNSVEVHLEMQFSSNWGTNQVIQLSCGLLYNTLCFLMGNRKDGITLFLRQAVPNDNTLRETRHYHHEINFDAPFNGVSFPLKRMGQPVMTDAQQMRDHFHRYIENLEERYPNNIEDQVRHVISGLLPSSDCSLPQVAATLNLHERVLQRRLEQCGSSYGELLRDTRLNMATELLKYSRLSVTEIALHLGYADLAVFSRNFKAWTGSSPREFRTRNTD